MKTVLVTGASGYIGSHVCYELVQNGFIVDGIDVVDSENTRELVKHLRNYWRRDIGNSNIKGAYDIVVHCAASISVEESMSDPSGYYENNVSNTLQLIRDIKTSHFIFASTAGAFNPISPYAKSKIFAEDIIKQHCDNYTILRFFNVAGSNGKFRQIGKSTHLIRIAAEVAAGKRQKMTIFGKNYVTRDGTCIRDYIHVSDLADIHIKGLNYLHKNKKSFILNCGYGRGYSVKQIVNIFKKIKKGVGIEYQKRRAGDITQVYANTKKFKKILKWKPKYNNIKLIIKSAINWEKKLN